MTLTKMLEKADTRMHQPDRVFATKQAFKEWLTKVGLPGYFSIDRDGYSFSATESIRKLLITLIDEP